MTKATILPALAALFIAACGGEDGVDFCSAFPADPLCQKAYSGGNACTQALDLIYSAYDEGCASHPDCCFCQCWLAGHRVPENDAPCVCGQMAIQACDEELQGYAEQCLAAPSACRLAAIDSVENICSDWILD